MAPPSASFPQQQKQTYYGTFPSQISRQHQQQTSSFSTMQNIPQMRAPTTTQINASMNTVSPVKRPISQINHAPQMVGNWQAKFNPANASLFFGGLQNQNMMAPPQLPPQQQNYPPTHPMAHPPQWNTYVTPYSQLPPSQPKQQAPPPLYHSESFAEFPSMTGDEVELPKQKPARPSSSHSHAHPDAEFIAPRPEDMPLLVDDGQKPPFTYQAIIGMALMRAPNRKLSLSQIYKWIKDNFRYFRDMKEDAITGWQNSIRHNLSLAPAFQSKVREKDDPGKGKYWYIVPELVHLFVEEKPGRKSAGSSSVRGSNTISSEGNIQSSLGVAVPSSSLGIKDAQPPKQKKRTKSKSVVPEDLSSDATIPLSDADLPTTDDRTSAERMPPPNAPAMDSSPPIVPRPATRLGFADEKVPCASQNLLSSNKKFRRHVSMNDSGYYSGSGLSSSVIRNGKQTVGGGKNNKRKRDDEDRAENAIARMRSSSNDHSSPVKFRADVRPLGATQAPTKRIPESPLKTAINNAAALQPLTPAITLQRPHEPTPTNSANLRRHRQDVKAFWGTPEQSPHNGGTPIVFDESTFFADAFADNDAGVSLGLSPYSPAGRLAGLMESPSVRAAKRPRLGRSITSPALFGGYNPLSPGAGDISYLGGMPSMSPLRQEFTADMSMPAGMQMYGQPHGHPTSLSSTPTLNTRAVHIPSFVPDPSHQSSYVNFEFEVDETLAFDANGNIIDLSGGTDADNSPCKPFNGTKTPKMPAGTATNIDDLFLWTNGRPADESLDLMGGSFSRLGPGSGIGMESPTPGANGNHAMLMGSKTGLTPQIGGEAFAGYDLMGGHGHGHGNAFGHGQAQTRTRKSPGTNKENKRPGLLFGEVPSGNEGRPGTGHSNASVTGQSTLNKASVALGQVMGMNGSGVPMSAGGSNQGQNAARRPMLLERVNSSRF